MGRLVSHINITDNSALFRDASETAVLAALEAIGNQVVSIAKQNLDGPPMRVDTGLLRNSITHAVSGEPPKIRSYHADHTNKAGTKQGVGFYSGNAPNELIGRKAVYIGTNVSYATYVHEGTRKMAPNRFLKRAIEENRDELKDIVREQFENAEG